MGKEEVKCTVEFSPQLSPHSHYIFFHIFLLMLIIEMPGKSPALFLSQIMDLESNEIPSLPRCYSAVPFISSGLRWLSASMLSSAAKSRGEMSWHTSKSLKTEIWLVCSRNAEGLEKRKFGLSQMNRLPQT